MIMKKVLFEGGGERDPCYVVAYGTRERVLKSIHGLGCGDFRQKEQESANCLILLITINYKKEEIKKKLVFKSNLGELHSGLARLGNKTVFYPQCLPVKDFQSHKGQDQIQSQE